MKPTSNALTRLTQPGIGEAVQILVNAFTGDPLMEYLFPGHADRPEQFGKFFQANLEYTVMAGEAYIDSSSAGVAAWLFPGDAERPVVPRQDDPRFGLKDVLGEHTYQRLSRFTRSINKQHRELMPGSYCYLMFLGVDRAQQGKGTGSLLIRPVLERADEKRLPCLLDTMTAKNVAFYAKHDFEVRSETCVCGDGPRAWAMVRQPRP